VNESNIGFGLHDQGQQIEFPNVPFYPLNNKDKRKIMSRFIALCLFFANISPCAKLYSILLPNQARLRRDFFFARHPKNGWYLCARNAIICVASCSHDILFARCLTSSIYSVLAGNSSTCVNLNELVKINRTLLYDFTNLVWLKLNQSDPKKDIRDLNLKAAISDRDIFNNWRPWSTSLI